MVPTPRQSFRHLARRELYQMVPLIMVSLFQVIRRRG
jgi:hypothetical protein